MAARIAPEVVDIMSDVSVESEEDEQMMDPSNPRAHGRQHLNAPNGARNKPVTGSKPSLKTPVSRWDSDDDTAEDDVDEDLGVAVQIDDDDGGAKAKDVVSAAVNEKLKARLSSWAASRFLVPRSERKLPVLEEPPLEPLNDFILSDFGGRFRGRTGDVAVEKAIDDAADASDSESEDAKLQVGAPLFSADGSPLGGKESGNGDEKVAAKRNGNEKGDATRKRRENRYFITDLATKCFNCGQVGHMASVCANDKVQRPCYYCALRGHNSFACPHLPCSACLQLGHEYRDCPNRRLARGRSCSICGRTGHDKENCENGGSSSSSSLQTCMVCVDVGHLHCAPIPPPADRRTYCSYCAGNHKLSHCREYVEPASMSFSARLPRTDMKCFVCNTAGHIAAECPKRTGYNGGNTCFNCGERGHYASDCPRASSSRGGAASNRNTTGRKRGRNEFYADDYEEEDEDQSYGYGNGKGNGKRGNGSRSVVQYGDDGEDGSDDQYYYVPGGGGRKGGGGGKKPRVDEALPSYRGGNGNNSGGGGYKGNNNNNNSRNGGGGGGYKGNNNQSRGGRGGGGGGDRRRWQ